MSARKKPSKRRPVKSLTTTSRTAWDSRQPWPFPVVRDRSAPTKPRKAA